MMKIKNVKFYILHFHPVCNKNINTISTTVISVAAENYFFPIGAKHWKCVETFVTAYFLQPVSINIRNIHVKWEATFVFMIAAKNNAAVRQKTRRPVCLAKPGDLFGITAICIGDEHFHLRWCYNIFFKQVFILFYFLIGLRPACPS